MIMKKAQTILFFILAFVFTVSAQEKQISDCPTVDVRGGGVPRRNETSYFTADVDKKGKKLKIEYIWTVRGGKIIEGQGMETIAVKVSGENALSATVEIKGFPEGCSNSATETAAIIIEFRRAVLVDEYEKIPFDEEKTRLSKIDSEFLNKTDGKIYFVINLTGKQTITEIKKRVLKIKNYLTETLKIPKDRIVFIFTDTSYQSYQTKIYIVPASAQPPKVKDEIALE
jgi:hypothetical protein